MKSRTWMWMIAVYLFAALAMPVWTAAQEQQQQNKNRLRYVVTDLGTLGGTFAAAEGLPSSGRRRERCRPVHSSPTINCGAKHSH